MAINNAIAQAQSIYAYFFSFASAEEAKRQVSKELNHFARKYDEKTVLFLYSSGINPPGLGDFSLELICARFFSLVGINVEFVLENAPVRTESWTILTEKESELRILEFKKLAAKLLPANVNFVFTEKLKPIDTENKMIFFEETTRAQKDHNVYIMNFMRNVATNYPELAKSMLLEKTPKKSTRPMIIGLHVRNSSNQKHRNPKTRRVLKDIEILNQVFPDAEMRIFGDISVMQNFSVDEAANNYPTKIEIQFQESDTFSNAFFESLECDFWFQRDGGGIGVASVFSSTPYLLISSQTIAARIYAITGSQFGPIANANQILLLSPFKGWFGDRRTKRYLRKIHVTN
jgi:hypothetical protein